MGKSTSSTNCIIRNDPNEAGLLGAVHLVPAWMLGAYGFILAVDIGGTNIRVGIVQLSVEAASDLSQAETVHRLVEMLKRLINQAEKEGHQLAPFIGLGCPGRIEAGGLIEAGGQNLPGNWESNRFKLPFEVCEAIPRIGNNKTLIIMHNDAVMQGLSELPFMKDVSIWGIFTIGTGFGNALLPIG